MLFLPSTLNHSQASSNWTEQARLANWQIDAGALHYFDSSALALLLDLRREAVAANAALKVHNAPDRLKQLVTLYGVTELIA